MISKIKKSRFLLLAKKFIFIFPFAPVIAFAKSSPTDFKSLLGVAVDLISLTIPVLMSLAVLAFLVGVAKYILKGSSETERASGKKFIFWGIIGLFVMISIWSLVGILKDTFFSSSQPSQQQIPQGGMWI